MRPPTQESRLPQRGSQSNTITTTTPASTHRRGPSQQQEDEKRPRSQGSATTTSSSSSGNGAGSATLAGRRQSLIRPSPLKTVSSSSSRSTTTPTTVRTTTTIPPPSTSPRKPVTRQQQNARPTSPKKTDMPPPPLPRHGRSASLRQPLSASSPSSPGGQSVGAKGHTRHRSQIVTSAAPAKRVETPSTSTPTTPRSKASFTTNQQQSSPTKKTTVKSTAAATSTAPTELDTSLIPSSWPEVAALQTEVLQLHLFHSSSLQQHAEWQADSEAQLWKKYDTVAQMYRAIVNEEKEWQRKLNGQALGVWLQNIQEHNGRLGFAEQTQLLSQVVQEVTDLTDDVGGRYTLSIQTFENWFRKAQEIRNCRNQLDQDAAADLVVFIDPLSRSWRDELDSLSMKLEICSRQIQSLDILAYGDMEHLLHDSTLVRTAKGLDEMLNLMLDEVNSIRKIERDIVTAERGWVSQLTEQLTASVGTTTPSRGEQGMERGLWRSAFQA